MCFVYFVVGFSASATELQFAGVVGNSGRAGMWLVRSTEGRWSGGVVLDARGRIFTGGGDRILTLNHDGKLLWQTPLPEKGWVVGGATFAVGGQYLYFIAGQPAPLAGGNALLTNPFLLTEPNLCRVEMVPGASVEVLVRRGKLPAGDVTLTSARDGSRVYLGGTTSWNGTGTYSVFEIHADGTLSLLFARNVRGGRVSVDEAGEFYLGGSGQVQKLDRRGEPVSSFTPVALPSLGPVASYLEGTVMLTREALWDMGHYGFVARFSRAMKPAPGVVVQWDHRLGWTAQIADAPNGDDYIKSSGGLYAARIEDEKLKLLRRFGSLPEAHCLVLTGNGYIGVDGPSFAGLLWFDFDNERPDAVPVRGEFPSPATQGFAEGNAVLAYNVAPNHLPREYQPRPKGIQLLTYEPEPFVGGVAQGPVGEFDGHLTAVTRIGNFYFAIDAEHQRLARATADKPCELVPVAIGSGPAISLARLGEDKLLFTTAGTIHACQVTANGDLNPMWELKRWGGEASQSFGDVVYVATSAAQMLVADTTRHRLLLFQFGAKLEQPPAFQAQFGETDRAGDEDDTMNAPTLVSMNSGRAIVYDSVNQRVVKLRIR